MQDPLLLTKAEELQDCHDSYYAAIAELRRRLLAKRAANGQQEPMGAPGAFPEEAQRG